MCECQFTNCPNMCDHLSWSCHLNKCVKHEFLEKTTLDMASLIASKPKSTVRIGKQAFYNQIELPTNKAYEYTSKVMALNMMEKDANEGIEAFVNKRDPHWFS